MKLHPALFLATISCRSAAVAPSPAPPPPSRSDVPAASRDVTSAPTVVAVPDTLPPPYATKVNANPARLVQRAETESPRAPAGLRVSLWARDIGEIGDLFDLDAVKPSFF